MGTFPLAGRVIVLWPRGYRLVSCTDAGAGASVRQRGRYPERSNAGSDPAADPQGQPAFHLPAVPCSATTLGTGAAHGPQGRPEGQGPAQPLLRRGVLRSMLASSGRHRAPSLWTAVG